MLLKDYRSYFISKLTPLYDVMEAESFFNIALQELKGWRRVDLALNPEAVITKEALTKWEEVLHLLEQQKPIQYIFGKAHFYGLDFEVNANALIPRPETEELVDWIIKDNEFKGPVKVLDIGTGSGCIAVSLAKNLSDAQVSAIDVSKDALEVAQRNSVNNSAGVIFILQDILTTQSLPQQFDVIVSNPPYVRELEKAEIKQNVLDYEPHLALFVADTNPLLFYHKIAQLAQTGLKLNGKLYFEINQYLGNETVDMLKNLGFKDITLRQDIYGNDRMIACVI